MSTQISDLELGLFQITDKLGFIPDSDLLKLFPFGRKITEQAESCGGIASLLRDIELKRPLNAIDVSIPSAYQQLAGTEIALAGMERKKRFELSKPGTRKTIGVLSAIPVINEVCLPDLGLERKIKTIICCPTYIIPTWMREAERLLIDPQIAVITRGNRHNGLRRAELSETDIVILGYEMSYRRTGINIHDPDTRNEISERYIGLLTTIFSRADAVSLLERTITSSKAEQFLFGKPSLNEILQKIAREEKKSETEKIARSVERIMAETTGGYYFVIFDEVHNIVDPLSETAQALADLYRNAHWGVLVSGTGIRNRLSNLSYMAYLNGWVHQANDFSLVVQNDPKVIKALIERDANPIRTLYDVDPKIEEPLFHTVEYTLSSSEWDVYLAICHAEELEGKDQHLLLTYLLTNPLKILPENFEGDEEAEDSLQIRVGKFFDARPDLHALVESIYPSKLIETKRIIEETRARGEKVIVACEYSTNLTTFLESELALYGCLRIDQTVSSELREIELTPDELSHLDKSGLMKEKVRFRSDLSIKQRKELGIDNHHLFCPSDRQLALLEFQTNPEMSTLIATYGTVREGMDVQAAKHLIEYEPTTVPSRFWQMMARLHRSGQDEQVNIHQLQGANTMEVDKYGLRAWKDYPIQLVFGGDEITTEELEKLALDRAPDKSEHVKSQLGIQSRESVILLFNSLITGGVQRFVDEMLAHDNALFVAKNYNYQWDYSYSANCARLVREIVFGLENRIGESYEQGLDAGAGSATIARTLERPMICVDVNRYQLEYGMDACEGKGIHNKYYLGSYTNLEQLIPLDSNVKVFNPHDLYEKVESISPASVDLETCCLTLYFARPDERKDFIRETKRVLKTGRPLIIVTPPSKIDAACREQFLNDLEECGFMIDHDLTGTYKSKLTIDVDVQRASPPTPFEAYVIVTMKSDDDPINYETERDYFVMINSSKVVGRKSPIDDDQVKNKKGVYHRYHCSDFFNSDTGIDPKTLPIQGVPIHPELIQFADLIAQTPEDQLDLLRQKLEDLARR